MSVVAMCATQVYLQSTNINLADVSIICKYANIMILFHTHTHTHTDLNTSRLRHCLDLLIGLVKKPRFGHQFPVLAEACFELFYKLCEDTLTSIPFLTFLQLHHDMFFCSILDSLPHMPLSGSNNSYVACFLLQRGWVLKAIALELHLTSRRADNWKDYIQQALLKLGFLRSSEEEKQLTNANRAISSPLRSAAMYVTSPSVTSSSSDVPVEQRRMKLLELLNALACPLPTEPKPMPHTINGVKTDQFKVFDTPYTFTYNIHAIRAILARTCDRVKLAEICGDALEWNIITRVLSACHEAFQGWKQTVEVCLYECFDPTRDPERYEMVLFQILSGLLQKLSTEDSAVWRCLGQSLSATALAVMTKIREQVGFTTGRKATQRCVCVRVCVCVCL